MKHHLELGIELFNQARFFDAHEALEDAWRGALPEERLFLQGLTQVAVALHHHSTGNLVGARSVLERACRNLTECPDNFRDIDIAGLRRDLASFLASLETPASKAAPPYPRIAIRG